MKFICAPDSFKESMTAAEAAAAMARGVKSVYPDATCVEVPLADGGEGFARMLTNARGGELHQFPVQDALGRTTEATLGFVPDENLAIIDVAQAVGLDLIDPDDRDIRAAHSFGVGQLINNALDLGASSILIGLGGSATNDAGAGMLIALGARFLDDDDEPLDGSPASLEQVKSLDLTGLDKRLRDIQIIAACDVSNPLLGDDGASAIFGPQKGASSADVAYLNSVLSHVVDVAAHSRPRLTAGAENPGAGAAGGLGFALQEFLGAELKPGIDVVLDATQFADHLDTDAESDPVVVLTGEGSIDSQTLRGKVPYGVATMASARGIEVLAFAGKVGDDADVLYGHGFTQIVQITSDNTPLKQALANGPENLEAIVAQTLKSRQLANH